mgnify:CR=1 FL=1
MFETISPLFLIGFIMLLTVGEFFLSASWMPFFFRFGIPLMRKEFQMLTAVSSLEEYIGPLESQLPRSWQQPAIAFKALGSDELAFRQKFGQRNPAHGHVVYDRMRQKLLFTGYLPWSTLITPFIFVFILLWAPFEAVFLFLFVFMAILGFGILMAYRNYGRIAQVIETTFQEQIATDSMLTPELQTPLYEPEVYEQTSYDPYLPTNQQKSANNNTQIMLIAVLIGVGAVVILVSVITFLLLAG